MAIDTLYRHYRDTGSDINEHLEYMHDLCLSIDAKQVVELGVRSGVSTAAFLAAMEQTGGHVWSCDIHPHGAAPEIMDHPRWVFVWADDVEVVHEAPDCDVLFIDTSHFYEQTVAELAAYSSKVRPGGVILLHDTQLQNPEGAPAVPPFPVRQAAVEFHAAHPEWSWREFTHCWGLGVLTKGQPCQ